MKEKIRWVVPMLVVMLICCSCTGNGQIAETGTTEPTLSAFATTKPEKKEPVLTSINHYVIKADMKSYMTKTDIALFRKLVDGVLARKKEVTLSKDYDANLSAMGALKMTPYYFLVKKDEFSKDHTKIKFTYAYSAEKHAKKIAFLDNEYLTLINENVTSDMNELEKVLAIYKYFANRISYDYEWLDGLNMSEDKFLYPDIEIYQALKTNKGVCHTYTYLCEFALQQLGIECLRITGTMTGTEDDGHMWLLVRIDGKYYHCDPTWDRGENEIGLKYFGMTDKERVASGVDIDNTSIDGSYGEVSCSSKRFKTFRDVNNFEFNEDHSLTLYKEGKSEPVMFSTAP